MTLDFNNPRLKLVIIGRIYTAYPAIYLCVGDEYTSINAGPEDELYLGRITKISPIRDKFPAPFQAGMPLPDLTLSLENNDGYFNASLEANNQWAFRRVKLWAVERGQASFDPSTDSPLYDGYIKYPGGISFRDGQIELSLSSWMPRIFGKIPKTFFDEDDPDFALADPSILGKPIPILIGDFSQAAPPNEPGNFRYFAEAFCINTTGAGTPSGFPMFQICQPGPQGIGFIHPAIGYHEQGGFLSVCTIHNEDLLTGRFEADSAHAWEEGDRFWIWAKGDLNNAMIPALIENPAEVIKHLVTENTDLTYADDFDAADYAAVYAARSDASCKVRYQIKDVTDLVELISELAFELAIDLYDKGGKVGMIPWTPEHASGQTYPDIDNVDLVPGSFKKLIDPDKSYTNKIQANWNKNYYTGTSEKYRDWWNHHTVEETGLVTDVDRVRSLDFNWLYYDTWLKSYIQTLVEWFSGVIKVYQFRIGPKGLALTLGDYIVISFPEEGIDLVDVQVRGLERDYSDLTTVVMAYDTTPR